MYFTLLVLTTLIFVAVCIFYAGHRAASFFHPLTLYLGFHGLIFALRPWFVWLGDYTLVYDAYQFRPDDQARYMALIVANVGLLSFTFFSLRFGSEPFRFTGAQNFRERAQAIPAYLIAAAILLPLFVLSIVVGWQNRMTDKSLVSFDRATGVLFSVETNGYVLGASSMAVFFLAAFAWLFRFRLAAIAIVALVALPLQGIGTRGPTMVALLCMAFLYLYDRRRKWLRWQVVAIAVPVFMVFLAVGNDRGSAVREIFTTDTATVNSAMAEVGLLERMDFANLEMVEYLTWAVPRRSGTYEYFVDQLQLFTEPIPRAIWKDKPIGQPIRFFSLFDFGFPVGMTRSLPGQGWMQMGLPGVVLWCGLWGALLGAIYNRYVRSRQTPFATVGYFFLLSMMLICYRDGLLLSVARYGLFAFGPLLLWLGLYKGIFERHTESVAGWREHGMSLSPAERRQLLAARANGGDGPTLGR